MFQNPIKILFVIPAMSFLFQPQRYFTLFVSCQFAGNGTNMKLALFIFAVFIVLMQFFAILSLSNEIEDNDVVHGYNETCGAVTNPYSPLVNCSYL